MRLRAFQGFCMALADSVPGVSGGTIAFVLGFYEEFITALHDLFGKKGAARKHALIYLARTGIGWCAGMVLSIFLLSRAFTTNIYFLSSLFLGLTMTAIPFIILSERSMLQNFGRNLPMALLGFAVVFGMTVFRSGAASAGGVNLLALDLSRIVQLLLSGALAISAMVLPGISGSTLLLITGVYAPIIHALEQVLEGQWQYLPGLLVFCAGIVGGIGISIRYIRLFLRRHRTKMLYLILGLMAGSLYAIGMGPTTLETPQNPLTVYNFEPLGFFLGCLILFALEMTKRVLARHRMEPDAVKKK